MDCGLWSGCRLEPWRLYGVRAGLLGEDQKKKGKIERNKNKIFYLLNIIGIIYGPWASGGPGQVPLLPWLRAGPAFKLMGPSIGFEGKEVFNHYKL